MRGLGYSAVRLQLSWSLLEPQPGEIDQRYLDRIAQVVGWAKQRGIYVVLDLHQSAWSKYVYTRGNSCTGRFKPVRGGDGAPLWASRHAWPACAAGGDPENDPAVAEQFEKFWTNADGLQDHYTGVLVALAQRFRDEPAVAGYELMNEPQVGDAGFAGTRRMLAYWGRAIDAVVAQVDGFRQLFFVEPNVERTEADSREARLPPWTNYSSYEHVVYSPHVYRGLFNPGQTAATERFQPMVLGYAAVQEDARGLGLPLWIGEFGTDPSDDDPVLAEHYAAQDYYLLGGAFRTWKENRVGTRDTWALFDPPFGRGVPRESRIRHTARATPIATTGSVQQVSYSPSRKRFEVQGVSGARIGCGDRKHATVVFVPRGVKVRVEHARMKSFERAGGHDVYVFPDGGGTYRIFSGSGRKRTCQKN
jgi:endoglycosylceramidase